MIGLFGLVALYGIAYLLSENRSAVSLKLIAWGFGLQLAFALLILRTDWGSAIFTTIGDGVRALLVFADQGSLFVFGEAADPAGNLGMVFAFRVLPIVIFISSLFSVLYYMGVMQRVVLLMAKAMHRLMGVSGSESLAAAANVFMGQTEAPIIVSPYIPAMTRSELMALMTSGRLAIQRPSILPRTIWRPLTGDDNHRLMRPLCVSPARLPIASSGADNNRINTRVLRVGTTTRSVTPSDKAPTLSCGAILANASSWANASQAMVN